MEGWASGLCRHFAKVKHPKGCRGFESLTFRQWWTERNWYRPSLEARLTAGNSRRVQVQALCPPPKLDFGEVGTLAGPVAPKATMEVKSPRSEFNSRPHRQSLEGTAGWSATSLESWGMSMNLARAFDSSTFLQCWPNGGTRADTQGLSPCARQRA